MKTKEKTEIDHLNSEHTMALQRSKYIKIEDDMNRLAKVSDIIENNALKKKKENASEASMTSSKNENLTMRFCSTYEVGR